MCAPVGYCLRLNYSLLCALQRTHTHTRTHRRKRSADPAPSRFMGDAPASLQAIIVRCACALFSNTHQQPLGPVVVRLKGAFRALPPYPPSATAPRPECEWRRRRRRMGRHTCAQHASIRARVCACVCECGQYEAKAPRNSAALR